MSEDPFSVGILGERKGWDFTFLRLRDVDLLPHPQRKSRRKDKHAGLAWERFCIARCEFLLHDIAPRLTSFFATISIQRTMRGRGSEWGVKIMTLDDSPARCDGPEI